MTESRPRIIRRHDTDAATIGGLLRKSRGSFVDSVRYAIEDAGVVFGEAEAVHISREIYGHLPPPSAVLRQRPTTVTQPRESLAPTRPTRREKSCSSP